MLRLADGKPVFPGAIRQLPTATASQGGDAQPARQNRALIAGLAVDLEPQPAPGRGCRFHEDEAEACNGWPSRVDYDVVIYGLHGGPEWPGASLVGGEYADLIVPFNRNPWILRVHYGDSHFDEWRDRLEPFDDAAASVGRIGAWLARCWDGPFSCEEAEAAGMSNDLTRWSSRNWQGSEANGWFTSMIYPRLSDAISNDAYQENCASCHGVGRQGAYQSEFFGDGYIPPLVGFTMTGKWAAADTLAKLQDTHDAYGIRSAITRMMACSTAVTARRWRNRG